MTNFAMLRSALAAVLVTVFGFAAPAIGDSDMGGEGDWPFFCTLEGFGYYDAFRLETRADSPTGYVLWFYANGTAQSGVYPSVQETNDGEYLEVYGWERIGLFRDRHMLAYVKKTGARTGVRDSMSSLETSLRGTTPSEFEMHWSSCQALER